MTLADLQEGACVFIDANIFIYHFGGQSLECKVFLERCARRELSGYTATVILQMNLMTLLLLPICVNRGSRNWQPRMETSTG